MMFTYSLRPPVSLFVFGSLEKKFWAVLIEMEKLVYELLRRFVVTGAGEKVSVTGILLPNASYESIRILIPLS